MGVNGGFSPVKIEYYTPIKQVEEVKLLKMSDTEQQLTLDEQIETVIEMEDEEVNEEQRKKNEKLVRVHNAAVEACLVSMREKIDRIREERPEATSVTIMNPHKEADMEGFRWETIFRGFYNKEHGKYYWKWHRVAGIQQSPLQELKEKLGVTRINNISNPAKGKGMLLQIIF